MSRWSRIVPLFALLAVVALLGAACGSDSDDAATADSSTTTAGDTTTTAGDDDADTAFVKDVQGQLQQIGCYEGAIDGDDGAETQAAILAFQEAEGLSADDEVGPETEAALRAAVASGRHDVCAGGGSGGASTTSTSAGGGASTTSTTRSGGGGSTSTTSSGGGGGTVAPCTHDAIQAGLGQGETLHQWQCARTSAGQDYAGGTQSASGSSDRTDFILAAQNGAWAAYTGACDALPDTVKSYCESAQG